VESAASFPQILGVCVRIRSVADGDDVMVMMAIEMMAMVMMAMVMVIIVPEALRQVGWLRQRQYRSFHRLRAFY